MQPYASVAVKVSETPAPLLAVGVPATIPVPAVSVRPAGKVPAVSVKLYGAVPPVAESDCE